MAKTSKHYSVRTAPLRICKDFTRVVGMDLPALLVVAFATGCIITPIRQKKGGRYWTSVLLHHTTG
jgi:hypothetical protein